MDDFGSGYSSLNVLKDMPIDIMKIDRGLTVDIENSERGKAMLSTIVHLANRLYIPTIAEGVETESQYTYLKDIGCDSIQGFFFSKPVPQEEFIKLLDEADVPVYKTGESIPGHFSRRETDYAPLKEKVLMVGEADPSRITPRSILENEYNVLSASENSKAGKILSEQKDIDYVILPRAAYEALLSGGTADERDHM